MLVRVVGAVCRRRAKILSPPCSPGASARSACSSPPHPLLLSVLARARRGVAGDARPRRPLRDDPGGLQGEGDLQLLPRALRVHGQRAGAGAPANRRRTRTAELTVTGFRWRTLATTAVQASLARFTN